MKAVDHGGEQGVDVTVQGKSLLYCASDYNIIAKRSKAPPVVPL